MLVRILKIAVSVTLISVLLWGVDLHEIAGRLQDLDTTLAIVSFVLLSVQYPLSAWKWRKSLRLHGADGRVGVLLRTLCVAFFFNNFLPTAIGGDAYRAYRTFQNTERPAHAISAVVVERLLGILALLFIGYLCALYLVAFGSLLHREWIALGLAAIAAVTLLIIVAWRMRLKIVEKITSKMRNISKLEPFFHSMKAIKANRRHLAGLVGLSLLFQATAVITVAVMFASIGIAGALAESGFTAAASGAAGILPVSINGVGVMEGSFVIAALESGLPYSESVLIALCLRGFMLLSSVAFGILYALEPKSAAVLRGKGAG